MTLPIDLVLVRHGQSEGNAAKRLLEQGDQKARTVLSGRHTRSFRLTEKGCEQARRTGKWLDGEFFKNAVGHGFDRYFTSEYARAMETAALLDLPFAEWRPNFYLTERDWGDLDSYDDIEHEAKFANAMRHRDTEPFFWRPPNGESFAELCLRLDRVLDTLHRECSDKRVVIVCHGEVMWGMRVLLEKMPQKRFRELHLSKDPNDRIHNCQVLHYTRRNPNNGELIKYAGWMRNIRPADDEKTPFDSGWKTITRPRLTNEELLASAREFESILR